MKLGPLTKIGKKNRATPKNFDDDVNLGNCEVIVFFFQFMANLEQSGSRIPNAGSVTRTLPLIVAFHLTKTESRTKNADSSKVKGLMVLRGTFFETKNASVFTYQISSF